jgi:MFS family permease
MSFLSGPTVESVRNRRWFVFICAILENMLFAAPLFGWASLRQMLMDFGWKSDECIMQCRSFDAVLDKKEYESKLNKTDAYWTLQGSERSDQWNPHGCQETYFKNYSRIEWYDPDNNLDLTGENEWVMACKAQNEILNRYFTIGTSCLSGSTMIYGLIMDKYGCRWLRLGGMFAMAVSCILFSIASIEPRDFGWIVLPAVLCNGMGGILYIFTGFQLANFFPGGRSTVCALLIGSYNSSALVYPILYEIYTGGASFITCMTIHGVIAVITFIEAWINTPSEPIPEPVEDENNNENNNEKSNVKEEIPKFMSNQVLFSIPCILSLVTMCITVLRLSMYIGQMPIWFTNAALIHNDKISSSGEDSCEWTEENPDDNCIWNEKRIDDIVKENVMIFGFMQILCVVWAPFIGYVLDKKLTNCKPNPKPQLTVTNREEEALISNKNSEANSSSDGITFERVQKLRNTRDAYFITTACLLIFGALIIMQSAIKIQIITFALHTVIRTFIHSSAAGIYVNVFHMSHIGKLTGLGSIAGAIFSLIMDPLMKLVQGPLNGNPFYLNVVLLFASITAGFLPVYLHWFANKTEKEYSQIEKTSRNENEYKSS